MRWDRPNWSPIFAHARARYTTRSAPAAWDAPQASPLSMPLCGCTAWSAYGLWMHPYFRRSLRRIPMRPLSWWRKKRLI